VFALETLSLLQYKPPTARPLLPGGPSHLRWPGAFRVLDSSNYVVLFGSQVQTPCPLPWPP
jgi:hypothetical protein